jgi:four helix bundle protein
MSDSGGYLPIEDLDFFRDLETLCDVVREQAVRWRPFDRDTVGIQFVRSLDSVGANLVEGDGRSSDKESLHFFVIARASGREAKFWLRRARQRALLTPEMADDCVDRLVSVLRRLGTLMTSRRRRLSTVRDESAPYTTDETWADDAAF